MVDVAILHPGEMGAAVAAALQAAGHRVRWIPEGRSPETSRRAAAVNLERGDFVSVVTKAHVVVSVVPPDSASDVAGEVADAGFTGLFLDANAISPDQSIRIERAITSAGGTMVDGGIVGPPPWKAGTTRLALSGDRADEVAGLFSGSALEAVVVGETIGAASAFKLAFASWTKGTAALALAIDSFADAHGLSEALREEWSRRGMDVGSRIESSRRGSVPKAWRFQGEMREIAAALDAVDLPSGFFDVAGDLYGRLAVYKDRFEDPPAIEAVRSAVRNEGAR